MKITAVEFKNVGSERWPWLRVHATLEDGQQTELFSYYPDELSFSKNELIGLTVEQARRLRHVKDVAYLQS